MRFMFSPYFLQQFNPDGARGVAIFSECLLLSHGFKQDNGNPRGEV